MAGRPGTLPWNMATFTGTEPVTTLSDNFNFLNNQINDSGLGFTTFATDTGSPNNMVVTLTSPPVAYEAGMMICVQVANTNTGPCVINVNSLGNKNVVSPASQALLGGEMSQGSVVTLVYGGTNFRIVSFCPLNYVNSSASTTVTLLCTGYNCINAVVGWTAVTQHLVLNNVGYGVPIQVQFNNNSGSNGNFSLLVTNPAGIAATAINTFKSGGSAINNILTGVGFVSIVANTTVVFQGCLYISDNVVRMSY